MIFNSLVFAIFLPTVFILFWLAQRYSKTTRLENFIILVASYFFYGWWDWRFLSLLFVSSWVDFFVGYKLGQTENPFKRKILMGLSLAVNLGILGFFKYFNFFIDSFGVLLKSLGWRPNFTSLYIILPVGLSFYTFQSLSYGLDVYRRQLKPTTNIIDFLAFISFFPQLVAGPIERASNLLPQFYDKKPFNYEDAKDGLRMILWGLFKKVVIADKVSPHVDAIFAGSASHSGAALWIGVFLFAIQIYCDFSGYSEIAIGTANLFSFKLMRNFNRPYFSRNMGEFWSRWHISLSTWFRDYVYVPLGGNRLGKKRQVFNVFLTFVLSGLWHGANWTFFWWGVLHGLFYLPSIFHKRQGGWVDAEHVKGWLPSPLDLAKMLVTFTLVLIGWVFFRSGTVHQAMNYVIGMMRGPWFDGSWHLYKVPLLASLAILAVEWIQRQKNYFLEMREVPVYGRWAVYYALVAIIILYGRTGYVPFIYFQF